MEYYEDAREALIREIKEETNLDIKLSTIFDIHSNFYNLAQHTVEIWFLVEEYRGNIAPGDDIGALDFFSSAEIKEQNIVLAFQGFNYKFLSFKVSMYSLPQIANSANTL